MKKQQWILLAAGLGLIGGAAVLLGRLQSSQKLGQPAVRTSAIPGSQRLQVDLPPKVLDYKSESIDVDKRTLEWLPADTSFGHRVYEAPDGFQVNLQVVLMGSDRTSLHKTEFCLEGAGWKVDRGRTTETSLHMDRPQPYDLPIMKFIASMDGTLNGQPAQVRCVYLVWFVAAHDEYTARHWQRMWWMARDLLRTGVLQRWAAVSVAAQCFPGQEDATYERMKGFIRAAVPEFQLVPGAAAASVADAASPAAVGAQ
jgi:hypothetical protein